MSVENNVPEIRFKGFSGEWEVMTLDDYTTFRRGSFPQPYGNKEWYGGEGSMPFVQVVDVSKELSLVEETKQKISLKAQPRSVFVSKGSVVVTLQGTIGRVAVTQYDSFVDRTILIFESFSRKTDSSFWAYTIQNKFDLEKKRAPGGTIKTITKDALSSFDVLIPSTEEQTAIGSYFQKLDSLINQHQQKHDKLSNIKKAMLEKMFPKQGENIPEIRFKGFSGEWEESTLAEEAVVTTGYPFDSADFSEDGDLLVVTNGNIQNSSSAVDGKVGNRIASEKVTHLNQYKLNFGDILVTMDGSVGRTAKVIERNQILAQRVGRLVARNDTEFLYQSLNTGAFLETMTTISHGGTIKHISLSEIGSYIVQVPKDLNEQAKIGAYLKNLDDLIERHHKQITKLNNIKQACLSKMFV